MRTEAKEPLRSSAPRNAVQRASTYTLSIRHASKTYRGRKVVDNISLRVDQGEVVGLLGPNGAGKTTSFYMLVGLVKPQEGEIYCNNELITDYAVYKRSRVGIGYLPQEASIFRKLSVEKNVMAVLQTQKMSRIERKKRCLELLHTFKIEHIRKQKGDTLSGGERRRVEIARALAGNPKILLLDEPFAGVDPIAVKDIQQIIKKVQKMNIGILITDHNVRETLKIVDRAYIMFEGKILIQGTARELIRNKQAKQIYLGEDFKL